MFRLNLPLIFQLVLIIYDPILTLPREVDLLWSRKFRLAALLYIMARYMAILAPMFTLLLKTIVTTPHDQVLAVHLTYYVENLPRCS